MNGTAEKIPGYKVIGVLMVFGALLFGSFELYSHHHSAFEKMTGYQDFDAMIAAKIEYEEQVQRSIQGLSSAGDASGRAEKGDRVAQYQVGIAYLWGTNDAQPDLQKASYWFLKSATQGYAPAEYEFGRMYANHYIAGPKGHADAIEWYRKSAEGGYKWAQIHLGEIYLHPFAEDFGVERNFTEAYFWLSLGAATEDRDSAFVRDRDAAEGYLKPAELEAAKKRIDAWQAAHPVLSK